jgi:hypothetical protein
MTALTSCWICESSPAIFESFSAGGAYLAERVFESTGGFVRARLVDIGGVEVPEGGKVELEAIGSSVISRAGELRGIA